MMHTLPPIQPHTQAKHHILEYHIKQWFPILGSTFGTLRYIDGFCGPGEYAGGEIGSPLIALQAIGRHSFYNDFSRQGKEIELFFVDENPAYTRHLDQKLQQFNKPMSIRLRIEHKLFENAMSELIRDFEVSRLNMPPTLLFIDPFGTSGFPMNLLERFASHERVEVLINLNHNAFIRWLPDPDKHDNADKLYGGSRWRPALMLHGQEQSDFLVAEYESALRDIGWRGTSFEMVNSLNQTSYHLVFGTGNYKGLEAMKKAMRSASQTGEFRYTDRLDPSQPVLLGLDREREYPREIAEYLFQAYDGREIPISHLQENDIGWHRHWLPQDLRAALIEMEYGDNPRISNVRNEDGRRRQARSYPEGCYITFGMPTQRQLSF